MLDNKSLAYFQVKLIDLLLKNLPPDEVLVLLKSDPLLSPFYSYINTIDLSMLNEGSAIIKKWAIKNSNIK